MHNIPNWPDQSRKCGRRRPTMSWLMVFMSWEVALETREAMSRMLPVKKQGLGPRTPCISIIFFMRSGVSQ